MEMVLECHLNDEHHQPIIIYKGDCDKYWWTFKYHEEQEPEGPFNSAAEAIENAQIYCDDTGGC